MTPQQILAKLALARQAEFSEDAERVYLEALADIPLGFLQAGCFDLAKLPRADYGSVMPDVGTIRAAALAHKPKLQTVLPPDDADPRAWYRCHACFDTGWVIRACPGPPASICGRTAAGHYANGVYLGPCRRPHDVADRCPCRLQTSPDASPNAPGSSRRREWVE